MKKKYKSLFKNIGLFSIGSFGSKIISFLLLPLYTSILSTEEYGLVDLINSTSQLLIPILLLSIQDATLRFSMDPEYEKKDVISTTFKVITKGLLLLIIGILIIWFFKIIDISWIYLIFLLFSFLLNALNNTFSLYLKAKNKALTIAISGILCTLVTCVSNIVLMVVFKLGINGYMISLIIGLLVQVLYQLLDGKIYRDIHFKNYKDLSKPMINYSAPLIFNSISWWINSASDRYILSWISGVAVNGIYSVAYKIPTILTTFQTIFYNAWSISAISEFDKDDNDGFIGNNYMSYSFLSIIACSIIISFNLQITSFLYSKDFFSAWVCVPLLLVSTVFNGISQLEGSLFAAVRKTKDVTITTLIGAITNIILNLLLIPKLGALGAAVATMVGYFMTWVFRTLKLQSFIKMKVDWITHIISVILLISQAILATFNKFYYLQFFSIFIIIILHRKYIKSIVIKLLKRKNKV